MMTSAALVLLINIVSSGLKKWVYPRWGQIGVQVCVFIMAIIGAWYYNYSKHIPGLEELVTQAIGLFVMAVAFYEVILQRLSIFKVTSIDRNA